MAVYYRSRGFILSKDGLREADQLFNIYTEDFGKLKILGRAIRKIKSKLRSGIELFYLSEIEFIQGKNYKTLTDAVALDKFKNIRNDLGRLETAYKITELTDAFIKGQEPDQPLFNLLNETLSKLNRGFTFPHSSLAYSGTLRGRHVSSFTIYHYFLWNFLSFLGYQIDLYNCAACHQKLKPENLYFVFSGTHSGIICQNCSKFESGQPISPEIIKILRIIIKKDWPVLEKLKFYPAHKRKLETISEKYILYLKESQNML